jgi:hypothetical protein
LTVMLIALVASVRTDTKKYKGVEPKTKRLPVPKALPLTIKQA